MRDVRTEKLVLVNLTFIVFTLLSECVQHSDCPNGGQNYECASNICACASGYVLENDACIGRFINSKLNITFKARFL